MKDFNTLKVSFSEGFIGNTPVTFAKIYFPSVDKTYKFASVSRFTVAMEQALRDYLSCDSTGSIAQSEATSHYVTIRCESQNGYGEGASYGSFEIDVTNKTITNLVTGEVSVLKANGAGYLFKDTHAGYQKIDQLQLPQYNNWASSSNGYAVINGKTYICK
jgi:hypothetical protein